MANSGQDPVRLLQQARAGDREALENLLGMYRGYLHVMARSQIGRDLQVRLSASDLVQETVMEAYRDFAQFMGSGERELVNWLRRILVSNLADQVRHHCAQKRDMRREEPLERLLDGSSLSANRALAAGFGSQSSPSRQVARRESAVLLANALSQLPDDYQQVLILRHLTGLEFSEIATRMARSSAAVRMLWTRALERLHNHLEGLP